MNRRLSLVGGAVLLAALACSPGPSVPPSPAPPTSPQPPVSTEPATPAQLAASPPTQSRIPAGLPLSADGPWFAFESGEGLWAVNSDGTGLTQLMVPVMFGGQPGLSAISPAPGGGGLAVVVPEDSASSHWPRLDLVSLPDGDILTVTSLLPEGYFPTGDASYVMLEALKHWAPPTWSPDGRWLAFAGAMDGPSTDLYVYEVASGRVSRLTSGGTQVVGVYWSPDSKWIVHGAAEGHPQSSGPLFEVQDEWAARADGSQVRKLYSLTESFVDPVVGWIDSQTYITYSLDTNLAPACPPRRLRTVDLLTGESHILREAHFTDVAWDPDSDTALVAFASDESGLVPAATPRGLWVIDARTGSETAVTDESASAIRWSPELELFLASTQTGILAIQPTGEFIDLLVPDEAYGQPEPSAAGELAWVGEGLWVGTLLSSLDNPPRQVFPAPTAFATWAPDGSGLLFFTEGALVYAARPDFMPVLVAEGLSQPEGYDWVMP